MQVLEFEIPESDDAMFYRAMGLKMASRNRQTEALRTPSKLPARMVRDAEGFAHELQGLKNYWRNEVIDEVEPVIKGMEEKNKNLKNELDDAEKVTKFSFVAPATGKKERVLSAQAVLKILKEDRAIDPEKYVLQFEKKNGEIGYKPIAKYQLKKSTWDTDLSRTPGNKIRVYRKTGGTLEDPVLDESRVIEIKKPPTEARSVRKKTK